MQLWQKVLIPSWGDLEVKAVRTKERIPNDVRIEGRLDVKFDAVSTREEVFAFMSIGWDHTTKLRSLHTIVGIEEGDFITLDPISVGIEKSHYAVTVSFRFVIRSEGLVQRSHLLHDFSQNHVVVVSSPGQRQNIGVVTKPP